MGFENPSEATVKDKKAELTDWKWFEGQTTRTPIVRVLRTIHGGQRYMGQPLRHSTIIVIPSYFVVSPTTILRLHSKALLCKYVTILVVMKNLY